MLIEDYVVEIFTPPCDPGTERLAARARLEVDISAVLPYLNATLRGAVYSRGAQALTWKKGGHNIAFHAYEIAASNVEDRAAGEQELQRLIALVNRTWEQREELVPDHDTHQRPTPMAIFNLLPRTNCRKCGQPTCITYALKLAASQLSVDDCPPLFEPENAGRLEALRAMVVDAPSTR